ncbi:MAG: hypothetical protein ACP5QM_08260, partial [Caldisericum sp.]|uniref:hypothetical protein n=1 Tax=Caldisericum sp. TaxID=2499687 RepID=UPI003D1479C7
MELSEDFVNELKKELRELISDVLEEESKLQEKLDEEYKKRKRAIGTAIVDTIGAVVLRLAPFFFKQLSGLRISVVDLYINRLFELLEKSPVKDAVNEYIREYNEERPRLQLEVEEKLKNLEKIIDKQIKEVINELKNEADEKYEQFLNAVEKPASEVLKFLKQ